MSKVLRTVNDLSDMAGFIANTGYTEAALFLRDRADFQSSAALLELTTFMSECYLQEDGQWLTIHADGMLPRGLQLPWSSHVVKNSKRKPALRGPQRDILRRFLLAYQTMKPRCPFLYIGRQWYLDIHKFPTLEPALIWSEVITPGRWLKFADDLKRGKVSNSAV